jgi:DNA ligase-1
VYDQLYAVATASGEGAIAQKTDTLADLLKRLSAREARYTLRIPLGQLRLGIGDPTMMDGLSFAKAGDKSLRPTIERAYNVCSDLGYVAKIFWERGVDGLQGIGVEPGKPVRPALAERVTGPEEIIKRMGEAAIEPKFDGFRCQMHKIGKKITIFSRNLEETTHMFPDLVQGALAQVKATSAIFEGEALAYNLESGEFLPFQVTVQRKRKYDIEQMQRDLPLRLVCFDLLYLNGQDLLGKPYRERRALLEKVIGEGDVLQVAEAIITDDPQEIQAFFDEKVSLGLEGIVAKRLDSPYQAGARNFNWIKLKRSYQGELSDTVDCVIVGYWRGRGQRAQFGIGSLLTAVYDPTYDRFLTVSKVATGLSDEEWVRLREMLDRIATAEKPARVEAAITPDIWVEPRYVVEVRADEITRSPMHTAGRRGGASGYALRFPRVINFIREDKNPEDATTEKEIEEMFQRQGKKTASGTSGEG